MQSNVTIPVDGASADLRARVVREFAQRFGAPPAFLARAPGRVNLIGDYTHNDGFVLPMAIDRSVWIAFRPRDDRRVVIYSLDFAQRAGFEMNAEMSSSLARKSGWIEHVHGVAWALRDAGYPLGRGWDGVTAGDVPVGLGLSSNAALELATARAFAALGGVGWEPIMMARVAQRAETEWIGADGNITGQLVAAAGVAGHALLIDRRSLEMKNVPLPSGAAVVVMDTATRHKPADGPHPLWRGQVDAVAAALGLSSLRDIDSAAFAERATQIDPLIRKRARHVVAENERTVAAAAALGRGDVAGAGRLMDESHASLRDDVEVSRPELDAMVRLARSYEGCHGARMTGAGAGGCAIALVSADVVADFVRDVSRRYAAEIGLQPALYVCVAAQGASLETV
jgi:galactokinase